MGSPRKNPSPFLPIFVFIFHLIPQSKSASDYTTVVYKGCANQPISDPTGVYSQALSTLFGTLISQSSKSLFYKTTTGGGQATVTGLFQCRGDLSNINCYTCVSKLPILIDKLCPGRPVEARLHLFGCYMLYEVAGFGHTISGMEMLYKSCSGKNVRGAGFEEKRDTALAALENGIMGGGSNGFYGTNYEGVYAMGQCEGDVGSYDCGECVKTGVQRAQVECGSSAAGEIYLHKCFVSYGEGKDGVPKKSSAASYSSPTSSSSSPFAASSSGTGAETETGTGSNAGKTVAIIVGGAAGVGFLVICMMFARGAMRKKDDY